MAMYYHHLRRANNLSVSKEGVESGVFMIGITAIASFMYALRRKQRIKFERKDEKELYH